VALFRSDGHVARLSVDTAAPLREAKRLIMLLRERIGALADPLDPGFGYDLIRLDVPLVAMSTARSALSPRMGGSTRAPMVKVEGIDAKPVLAKQRSSSVPPPGRVPVAPGSKHWYD
jgi:hypothetical protein